MKRKWKFWCLHLKDKLCCGFVEDLSRPILHWEVVRECCWISLSWMEKGGYANNVLQQDKKEQWSIIIKNNCNVSVPHYKHTLGSIHQPIYEKTWHKHWKKNKAVQLSKNNKFMGFTKKTIEGVAVWEKDQWQLTQQWKTQMQHTLLYIDTQENYYVIHHNSSHLCLINNISSLT